MAMTIKAYDAPEGYKFVVTLDDTKLVEVTPAVTKMIETTPAVTDENGVIITPAVTEVQEVTPAVMGQDPAYVRDWTWGRQPPEGQDLATYLGSCKREALLLAQDALDRMTVPPAPEPQEIDLSQV